MTPPELNPGASVGSEVFDTDEPPSVIEIAIFVSDTRRAIADIEAAAQKLVEITMAETAKASSVTPFDRFCFHAREYGLFLAELAVKGVAYAAVIVLALQVNEHLDDIIAFVGSLP